jgi:hypothetical protein
MSERSVIPQINFPEVIELRVDVEKVFSARGLAMALALKSGGSLREGEACRLSYRTLTPGHYTITPFACSAA